MISVSVQDQFGDPDPTVGSMPESCSQTSIAQLVELLQAERSAAEDREKRLKVDSTSTISDANDHKCYFAFR